MFDTIGLGVGPAAPVNPQALAHKLVSQTALCQVPARRAGDRAAARPASETTAKTPGLGTAAQLRWLAQLLDEVDNGMLLVNGEAQVLYMNHAARMELDGQHPPTSKRWRPANVQWSPATHWSSTSVTTPTLLLSCCPRSSGGPVWPRAA